MDTINVFIVVASAFTVANVAVAAITVASLLASRWSTHRIEYIQQPKIKDEKQFSLDDALAREIDYGPLEDL